MTYSILITSYECYGRGAELLRENLDTVFSQTYRPIQCIVSDHSRDNAIADMVKTVDSGDIEFLYLRYDEHYGNPVMNWKNALQHATGKYIHYLAMDEGLASRESIQTIVDSFDKNPQAMWLACSQIVRPRNVVFTPSWNSTILQMNTLSGPGAIVIRSDLRSIEMDPQFIWYLDLDWYYRLWKHSGPPYIVTAITLLGREHDHQLTNTICNTERRDLEDMRMRAKYGDPLPYSC